MRSFVLGGSFGMTILFRDLLTMYYFLLPDFGNHIFFLQKTWFNICSLRIFKSSYGSEDEIEETVKPFTTYLLQLEKVIRDFILYATSEREVAGRRWHCKRFFASDCRILST